MANVKRNEIWYCDFGKTVGSEQFGTRPCLIVQNDRGNEYGNVTMVCPITTRMTPILPTHVTTYKLRTPSTILCEQIKAVDKHRLLYKVCDIEAEEIKQVNRALRVSLDL